MRNLFTTTTGKYATVAAICGLVAAILPYAGNIWIRGTTDPTAIANRQDAIQILLTVFSTVSGAGGLGALYGRYNVMPETAQTYTPKFFLGRDKNPQPSDWDYPTGERNAVNSKDRDLA